MTQETEKYFNPDPRWKIWGINSRDDFNNKVVVSGRFHNDVPKKIIDDFIIVERLLWYSYFFYPLFDEALSKATRIFESSITHKIKDLDLDKENKIKNLSQKIRKLKPHFSPEAYLEFEKAREIRNLFAHPTPGNLMGMVIYGALLQIVNIVNSIFLDQKILDINEQKLKYLQDASSHLRDNLFTYVYKNHKILVWSIIPYNCFEKDSILKSFWIFHPVLQDFPQTMDSLYFSPPIGLTLSNLAIDKNGIKAIDLQTDQEIEVTFTQNPIDIALKDRYKSLLATSDQQVKDTYFDYLDSEMSLGIIKFKYYECWE